MSIKDQLYPYVNIHSENSVIIYFAQDANPKILAHIDCIRQQIQTKLASHYIESIACYNNLTIFYNIQTISTKNVLKIIKRLLSEISDITTNINHKIIKIPVYYHQDVGLDLLSIAQQKNLSIEQIIDKHSTKLYQVYGVGFTPNFAYLGTLDAVLCTPRHTQPRASVPAGSVGIADCQTGIYPSNSPAGWQIIGQTPLDLSFKSDIKFQTGNEVKFYSIDREEFLTLGGIL